MTMMAFAPILALYMASCSCGPPRLPPMHAAANPRHVVLISLDTVRADALGTYGGPAKTTHIDALADVSVVFENHISAAPSTLASHTSMMTGQYPHTHGVPRNGHRLSDYNVLLAEVLQAAGFETAAILGAMPLGSHANFLQGFDFVDDTFRNPRETMVYEQAERPGSLVTDAALAWLDGQDSERVFLFVHYFDAHQPYEATANKDDGSMRSIYRLRNGLTAERPLSEGKSESLKSLYWAEIASVDTEVGRLLDGLKTRGMLENALVVLTADHGEAYADHGEFWEHGTYVYDQTVHTPLIVSLPGAQPRRIPQVVSGVDLVPTIYDVLELEMDPVDGRSVLPLLQGEKLDERPVFSEATKPWDDDDDGWQNANRQKAVRIGDLKLVWDPISGTREVFRVSSDPTEANDLSDSVDAGPLNEALDSWIQKVDPLDSERVIAPDITEQLEALGYVE